MVADARKVEEPGLVLGELHARADPSSHRTAALADRVVLVDVRRVPLLVGRQVAEHPSAVRDEGRSRPPRRSSALRTRRRGLRIVRRRCRVQRCPSGVGLLEHLENLRVPALRVAAVGLGLDVGPPHVLLALAERPGGLARHRAALAGDAAVDVEDEGELPVGERSRRTDSPSRGRAASCSRSA